MFFQGKNLTHLPAAELRTMRQDMQIIFQDPFSSLNPRMTVGAIIGEALAIHGRGDRQERAEIVRDTMQKCGLDPTYINRFPHEFSGGQRQRISIARALALNPKFIVCDEPVSALDVSIQSQIINLLAELKERYNLAYLFIAHDLSVVEYISDRVAVMYLGKIVELADSTELYGNPLHPYTQALLSAVPVPDPTRRKHRTILPGDVPSPLNPPSGCRFHPPLSPGHRYLQEGGTAGTGCRGTQGLVPCGGGTSDRITPQDFRMKPHKSSIYYRLDG